MIIGIHGRAQSGKDTLARVMQHATGAFLLDCAVLHFADALRDVAQAIFGSRYETAEEKANIDTWWQERIRIPNGNPDARIDHPISPLIGDFDLTGRRILQYLGTEIGRHRIHPDIWLFAMERRISQSTAKHHIIADVRFDNEARWIHARKGVVLAVARADHPPLPTDAHASEQPIAWELINEKIVAESVDALSTWGHIMAKKYLGVR